MKIDLSPIHGWIPKFSTSVFLVLAPVGLVHWSGCAHRPEERQVERKVAAEPDVKDRATLEARTDQTIEQATGITDVQRTQLTQLRDSTRAELLELSQQSLKLRAVLAENVIHQDYDSTEVGLLKEKLKDTEGKKVAVFFKSIDRANGILGRQVYPVEQRERIMRDLMEPRSPRSD